jgi:hypothetical protein
MAQWLKVPAPELGEIVQVTPCREESFCSVAVRSCVVPAGTVSEVGATEIVIGS